jgi:hypothetical protein
VVKITVACVNTWDFFTLAKLEDNGQSLDPNVKVWNVLATMKAMGGLFKTHQFHFEWVWGVGESSCPNHHRSCEVRWGGHIAFLTNHLNWPWNNVCWTSSFIWSMTISQVWCIHVELEQECNKWWWHVYCILYQFCHCWWDPIAYYWGATSLGYTTHTIPRLYWIY